MLGIEFAITFSAKHAVTASTKHDSMLVLCLVAEVDLSSGADISIVLTLPP